MFPEDSFQGFTGETTEKKGFGAKKPRMGETHTAARASGLALIVPGTLRKRALTRRSNDLVYLFVKPPICDTQANPTLALAFHGILQKRSTQNFMRAPTVPGPKYWPTGAQ